MDIVGIVDRMVLCIECCSSCKLVVGVVGNIEAIPLIDRKRIVVGS